MPNALKDKSAVLWTKIQHLNWNARQVPDLNQVLATSEFRPRFSHGLKRRRRDCRLQTCKHWPFFRHVRHSDPIWPRGITYGI